MNLNQLLEANILNIDAVTAAKDFPYDFKQEIAKVINSIVTVDRKETFKGSGNWENQQRDYKLFNKYGTAEPSDRYSSGDRPRMYKDSKSNTKILIEV